MRLRKYIIEKGTKLWQCNGCKQWLPTDMFYKNKGNIISNITSRCKSCHIEQSMRTRDPDNTRRLRRESMRRMRKSNPDKFRIREREYQAKRPRDLKTKARVILNNAVRDGRIIKPTNCSQCGKIRKLTAHHKDYSKPFQVRWLCYECHGSQTVSEHYEFKLLRREELGK